MVTHDVLLKNFANRVVKIYDGKIVGQEIISHEVRNQQLRELEQHLLKPGEGVLLVREGVLNQSQMEKYASSMLTASRFGYIEEEDQEDDDNIDLNEVNQRQFPIASGNVTSFRNPNQYLVLQSIRKMQELNFLTD
jgi:hypothetical protein